MAEYLTKEGVWNTTTPFDPPEIYVGSGNGDVTSPQEKQDDGSDSGTTAIIVILCTFSVVGTLGNGLVLYVFTRSTIKLTSTIFILALAGTDFVTCLLIIPYTVIAIHVKYVLTYDIACKIYQFLITCNVPLSAFIMVAIAVDRYLCICHPFLRAMTVRRAKIIVGILASFAILLGVITALGFSVYEVVPNDTYQVNSNRTAPVSIFHNESSTDGNIGYIYPDIKYPAHAATNTPKTKIVFNGLCKQATTLYSMDFINVYQKIYSSFYLFSLLIVLILYGMIYRSVTKQRSKRRQQKMGTKKQVKQVNTQCQTDESTMPLNNMVPPQAPGNAALNNAKLTVEVENETVSTRLSTNSSQENGVKDTESHPIARSTSRKQSPAENNKERKDHNRLANIKTAVMLFIVTIVFIVAFLPAWLMAHRWLEFEGIIFYMYFAYNVGNPVIYAFMNQIFRETMCKIISSFSGYINSQ